MSEPTQICRGFTDEQWKALRKHLDGNNDEAAWRCAIDVFERRLRERFISSIEALQTADSGPTADREVPPGSPADCSTLPDDHGARIVIPGFAIMGLCCLLIETLQSFCEATKPPVAVTGPCNYPEGPCIRPTSSTTDLFISFLRRPAFSGAFADNTVAKSFVRGVRNGILHEAETRSWVIWRDSPRGRIVETRGSGYAINRTAFFEALRTEFEEYLKDLKDLRDPSKDELRRRFIKKMDDVAKEC